MSWVCFEVEVFHLHGSEVVYIVTWRGVVGLSKDNGYLGRRWSLLDPRKLIILVALLVANCTMSLLEGR